MADKTLLFEITSFKTKRLYPKIPNLFKNSALFPVSQSKEKWCHKQKDGHGM